MSDERFGELVNLFLDREIGASDLRELRRELRVNPSRRDDFEDRCRLHRALRMALNSEGSLGNGLCAETGWASRFLPVPSLALGVGFAAALALAAVVFTPVIGDALQDRAASSSALSAGGFDRGTYEGLRGHASTQASYQSLTAQLRLAGLSPEIVPVAAETRVVARETISPEPSVNRLPSFFEIGQIPLTTQGGRFGGELPAGFESSLLGY